MKNGWLYLLAALLLISCSGEAPKETVSLDDIIRRSDTYREEPADSLARKIPRDYDRIGPQLRYFLDSLHVSPDSVQLLDTLLFADRFGADSTFKLRWTDISGETRLYHWQYSDSNKVRNALFNWLDCFGPDCASHRLYEQEALDRRFTAIWAGSRHIFLLHAGSRYSLEEVERLMEYLVPGESWLYRIYQPARSRTRWYEKNNNRLQLIRKTHENS